MMNIKSYTYAGSGSRGAGSLEMTFRGFLSRGRLEEMVVCVEPAGERDSETPKFRGAAATIAF